MSDIPELDMVYVEWVDSTSYGSTVWSRITGMVEEGVADDLRVSSVGYRLAETDGGVLIAGHVARRSDGWGSASGGMLIPWQAILRYEEIVL